MHGTWQKVSRWLSDDGRWHRPPLDVVAAYVDQNPENDLSRKRSEEFGFPIYPTVAETLRVAATTGRRCRTDHR